MTRSQKKRQNRARREAAQGSRTAVANVAPITTGSGPLMTTAASLKTLRQNKHNPLPYLKPDMLSRALEAFEHGRIREAVLLWEKMAERDDMIMSVKPKREKDVSQLDMQVIVTPDSGAEGEAHQAVLEKFWKSVRAVNAYDRNERGGFRRLVKQMMTATSFKYAAHHIIWEPRPDGELRATFEFVPLWLFENTTGKLRYLNSVNSISGEILDESEWMVTVGDGLMIACCIGYMAKRSAFNDWLIFSEKFSVPGVLGRTSAAAGTPEAIAMEEAVQAFGHDWAAVITGDDGTHAEPIKIVQAEGNPAGMPMPAVIERVDRRMAALYRGADLSSMSSGPKGEGSGASLQEKETDILRRDDAETIAETLADVSRLVIEWHFGNGTEPLARVELMVPGGEDQTKEVDVDTKLAALGVTQDAEELAERYGRKYVEKTEDGKTEDGRQEEEKNRNRKGEEISNSQPSTLNSQPLPDAMQELRDALAADLQPLGDALFSAYQAGDEAAMQAALRKISKGMPELAGDAEELTAALSEQMAAAWLGDDAEDVANAARYNPQVKGAGGRYVSKGGREGETRSLSRDSLGPKAAEGMSPDDAEERLDNCIALALRQKKSMHAAGWRDGLGMIDLPWGTPGDRSADFAGGHGLSHIIAKHGEKDARKLPWILSRGEITASTKGDDKREVSLGGFTAVMVREQPSRSWLLTGFTKKQRGGSR